MIECMISGGGKSPTLLQSLNWGIAQPITAAGWWPWIIFTIWVLVQEKSQLSLNQNRIISITLIMLTFAGIASPQSIYIGTSGNQILGFILGVIVITSIVSIAQLMKTEKEDLSVTAFSKFLKIVNFFLLFGIVLPTIGFGVSSTIRDDVSSLAPTISAELGLGGVVFTVLLFLSSFSSSKADSRAKNHWFKLFSLSNNERIAGQIICVFLVTLAASNSMVAGFTAEAWAVAVGLLIAYIASCLDSGVRSHSTKFLIPGLLLPFIIFFSVRIISEPYFWWALRDPPLEIKRHSIPINSMAGFRTNSAQREVWLRLEKSVASDLEAKIFAGPNIGGVPFMIGREPDFNKCPIIWWDVCPENLALQDLDWLRENPPRFIMWSHQPNGVIFGHEQAFRSGKTSAVSIMQNWIDNQLAAGSYRLIDTVQLTPDNAILIMKLN